VPGRLRMAANRIAGSRACCCSFVLQAMEFTASFSHQFDQAGIFIHVSHDRWVKAGVEFADGRPQIGAVVTDGRSDWSLAPVPDWAGQRILMRVSRSGDALTIRAKPSDHGNLQLIRVVPFEPELVAFAGPLRLRAHAGRSHREISQLALRATRPEPELDRRAQR
jgi:regulation of enolase protein 1 (concanavalin A-like superfamily)